MYYENDRKTFGTLDKNYALSGELKCRHFLLFLMEYVMEEYYLHLYLLIDDLSSLLNASRIGCHISDVCINHVFYADDLCLMAPCAIALQELLNPCTTVCNFRWFCKYQCVNRMQLLLIYGISGIFPTLTLHCTHSSRAW